MAASVLGADSMVTGGGGSDVSVGKIEPPSPVELQALRKERITMIFSQRRNFILCLSICCQHVIAKRRSSLAPPVICYELPRIAKQFEFKNQAGVPLKQSSVNQ